jgi:hypothetical protein
MHAIWSAETTLDASPEFVWSVLVDFDAYPSWNPFTRQVRTSGVLGTPVVMTVDMGPLGVLEQTETLRVLDAPRQIVWALDTLPRWLQWARRTQTLTALPDGRTHYQTVDEIGGALLPIVRWRYGASLERGFASMAAALNAEVTRRRAL